MIEQKFPFIFGVASGYKILYDHNRFFKKQMEKIKELAKKEKIKNIQNPTYGLLNLNGWN